MILNKYIEKISLIGFASLCLSLTTSCTDNFLKYNTNPDEATEDQADWDNVKTGSFFLQMQQNVAVIAQPGFCGSSRYQIVEVMGGDTFVGYFGIPNPALNAPGRYNWTGGWGDLFTGSFSRTMNAWRELRRIINDDDDPRFAIAQIIKVATMHRVTDSYGPIPYLNFGLSKEVHYDSQRDIYYKFFEELAKAIEVLDSYAAINAKVYSDWDLIYKGDVKSWVKFANSLRLRLAMHLAYVEPEKAKTEAEAAVANQFGLMSTKADLAELLHSNPIANYESPLYIISGWDDVCMGATLDSYMNGYNDPRRNSFFNPTSDNVYRGIRTGMPSTVSKSDYASGKFSKPNVTPTTNVLWMRSSESYFLKAEGALRGWNMGGTAQSFYEQGIRLSFEEHGVAGTDNYLANKILIPANYVDPVNRGQSMPARGNVTIAWDEKDNFEKKLEKIITQKYIALFPVGQEAWTEFRRTGYPKVFPVVANESNGGCVNSDIQIRRLPFPSSEYNTNFAVLAGGIKLLNGPDNAGTKLWWDAKK